jgi:xylulokinase
VSGSATVGIDIGSTAVKAVAVDGDGRVRARARVPHSIAVPGPELLEHDAGRAWRRGPRQALAEVATGLDVKGVGMAGMVPSLTAVNRRGVPIAPGLLYGDARGVGSSGAARGDMGGVPDGAGFVRWAAKEHPEARGYWPAQAVASFALADVPVIDGATSMSFASLLDRDGTWSESAIAETGAVLGQMPVIAPTGAEAGRVRGTEMALAAGTVDAFCDQIVAGADEPGDVLVVFGATLIVWAVIGHWTDVPGLWTLPHTTPDRMLVGGPSNAGALFVDWARDLVAGGPRRSRRAPRSPLPLPTDPTRVPVWLPYPRGERAPFHDPGLRASLHDLDLTHDAAALERGAFEASGFVIRHLLDRAGVTARRVVASGGGTQVGPWMQAVADATGVPVETVAVHEGAAFGAAFLGRMAAGLESSLDAARGWARTGERYEPDTVWAAAAADRYSRFRALNPGG